MDAVRESSQELMSRLVQVLLDEGVTAQTFDLDTMPFAAMEQWGHGLGKVLARQIQGALAQAQAARLREQSGDTHLCPQCGRSCPTQPQSRTMQTLDGEVEFREPKCVCPSCRKSFFPSA